MSALRIVQVVCVAVLVSGITPQTYDDPIQVSYGVDYNEIGDGEQSEAEAPTETPFSPCTGSDLSKWDKLFTMLENSQMKENMLLQYSDDIVKVGMKSLRAEMLEIVAQASGSCAAAVQSSVRRSESYCEQRLLQTLDQLQVTVGRLQELHSSVIAEIAKQTRDQVGNLYRIEQTCMYNQIKSFQTRDLDKEGRGQLHVISTQLHNLHEKMESYTRGTARQILPTDCDMALFFPMRSAKMHAEIIPERSMKTRAVTVCLWIKPTQMLNKTVLFSYGTATNPLELQLLLRGNSAFFTVGGEAHLVEARDAATERFWVYLCGTWSSDQGLASLWINGHKAASSPGVAEGHEIPADGITILGQEYTGESLAKRFGFPDMFNAEDAFTGKLTGVNVWDRVLEENEISKQAFQSCSFRGNLVAWGVSQILEREGVKLIY